ncbi:RNase H domain-containing protein [Trichonephila clavipes]|nr:RNase H domain-containing protein [Trichonephila clavipes]
MYPDLFLTVLKSCLSLKTCPRCLKKARIILIPNVNDVRVPKLDNLRCISLLSTLGHTGIYGYEHSDRLAKEATKLSDLIPMSIPKSYHKKNFKEKIISEWNNLYQISNNAHLTKEFISSIQSRLKAKHFHPNFKLTQFLTVGMETLKPI